MRTQDEINSQVDKAAESMQHGTSLAGMCYEEGVRAALDWVTGDSDELPMED